uniref:WRKY19-like zinc finger domain-containing protein n=1 Tax=Ditylum brightwellii TaxID=49249 RepID=A0A6V2CYR2_9STRA
MTGSTAVHIISNPPPQQESVYVESTPGQKHRLGPSSGTPNTAHRRLNSIGEAVHIERKYHEYGSQEGHIRYQPPPPPNGHTTHHRVGSAGLDLLTAAADVSKEELAVAAGVAPPSFRAVPPTYRTYTNVAPPREYECYPPPPLRQAVGVPPPTTYYTSPPPPPPPPPHYYSYPRPVETHPRYQREYPQSPPYYCPPQTGPLYPVQHSQPPPYEKYESRPPTHHRQTSSFSEKIETDEQLFQKDPMPPPPRPGSSSPSYGRAVSASTISTDMEQEYTKPVEVVVRRPSPRASPLSMTERRHHRVTSSFSSIGTFAGNETNLEEAVEGDAFQPLPPERERYRRDYFSSSPPSFTGRRPSPVHVIRETVKLESEPPRSAPTQSAPTQCVSTQSLNQPPLTSSKRIRRKCTVAGCPNRVVQGGLCISHGAKRKTCSHPGCTKNVKKAGLCSAHGPARKKCDMEGCNKVAVQGGRCISHGAKKKLCYMEGCKKQAILLGMCKKHHDEKQGIAKGDKKKSEINSKLKVESNKTQHRRGLSIFQDMSAVDTIIGNGSMPPPKTKSQKEKEERLKHGHRRGLSLFTDEKMTEAIIQNNMIL